MRSNVLNVLMFLVTVVGLYFLMSYAEKNWFPKPDAPKDESAEREAKQKVADERRAAAEAVAGPAALVVEPRKPPEPPKPVAKRTATLIPFGDDTFYTRALLTTEGGGVQQVVLTRFTEADRLGREVKGVPLYLIPGVKRTRPHHLAENYPTPDLKPGRVEDAEAAGLADPCYTIFHYPTRDDKYPDAELGRREWTVAPEYRDTEGNAKPRVSEDGAHEVAFEATLGEPYHVKFRKTYTLAPKDYHVSMRLAIERLPGGRKGEGQLRYQLSGPRGLPIEGEWYTTTYRVALIGWTDSKGRPQRQYEPATEIAIERGGDEVARGQSSFKYMAVATQFFASAVAIDDRREEGVTADPWAYVRATSELPFDQRANPNTSQFDDMTVRAASEMLDIEPGKSVVHKYVIYNGPAKAKLLGLMEGDRAVDEALVTRYTDGLGLKTITDFQSPTWLGSFANTIYWTDLVIAFTNLMHGFLATIHNIIPSWALSIVVLTVVVRLLLFIPSRKQTQMNMKMMEVQKRLAPQFEELKKKHEGDPHAYNRAKMQLMMANGVNPFAALGGCLLLLAQMPIMMGLYFCLQESVFFRLEQFLWIDNLAAPDMTLWWSEKIPFISTPDGIGGMLYLGPYLNILPILAVGLMFWQQLKMLPPPTDEQARQQRFMMKMMMFLMPLFFYKFAAGLAIYFIISTAWGLAERKLIPKPDPASLLPTPGSQGKGSEPAPPKAQGWLGRKLEAMREKMEEMKRQADEQSRRQIRNERGDDDRTGQQGHDGQQGRDGRDNRRDRKKKRRK